MTRPRRADFDFRVFLDSVGEGYARATFRRSAVLFTQGSPADCVIFITAGVVIQSIVSPMGKQAVVGVLSSGEFLGEEALGHIEERTTTASALRETTVLVVAKQPMHEMLGTYPELADRFLSYQLARAMRTEEALVDQLFNSSEQRLARALLTLAQCGQQRSQLVELPTLSQDMLADMIGATRSRVNVFMNKFRRLGFIDYTPGHITVHGSLACMLDSSAPPHA